LLHYWVPKFAVMKTSQKWNSVASVLLLAITVIPIGVCYGKFIRNCIVSYCCLRILDDAQAK